MIHRLAGLVVVAIGCTGVIVACSSDESTPGTSTGDSGTGDANTPTDSSTVDGSTPVDSAVVDPTCGGCVKGPNGNGSDTITLATVTGIDDGKSDPVVVTGTFKLESADTATITSTCEGQSSGQRLQVGKSEAGAAQSYSLTVDFQNCTTDIVKVTLFPVGASSSDNYVKCCFKKGRDF